MGVDQTHKIATEGSSASTARVADDSGYRDLRRGLVSAAIGLAAFYGARGIGASPIEALNISTLLCAGRSAYVAMRRRRFDAIASFLMFANAVTLTVAICARSPVAVMFGRHLPGVVFLVFVLGSLAVGRPVTESLIKWLRPHWVHAHISELRQSEGATSAYHRTHMRLTAAIAVAQTIHLAVAAIVILALSVDVAQGLLSLLALVTDVVVLLIAIRGCRRFPSPAGES